MVPSHLVGKHTLVDRFINNRVLVAGRPLHLEGQSELHLLLLATRLLKALWGVTRQSEMRLFRRFARDGSAAAA
jgi:hypothetical protein